MPRLAEARRRDAEALRAPFHRLRCRTVRLPASPARRCHPAKPITKNSSELLPALREILDKTEIGHLTAPEMTPQGVELFALCERKETKANTPEKSEAPRKSCSASSSRIRPSAISRICAARR